MGNLTGKLKQILDKAVKGYSLNQEQTIELSDAIDSFSRFDPSKTNKYVGIMTEMLLNEPYTVEAIRTIISKFHSIQDKLIPEIFDDNPYLDLPDRIISNPKDIQNYKTYQHLDTVYILASNHKSKKETKNKIVEEETDIIYDEKDYTIVVPLSFESSCYWGVDTKWCTTMREDKSYFNRYTDNGSLFYIIDKYRANEKNHPMGKFAYTVPASQDFLRGEIYNRPDISLGSSVDRLLPSNILTLMNQYHTTGGIIDIDKIYESYVNFANRILSLPYDDSWFKSEINQNKEIIFTSDMFPSYCGEIGLSLNKDTANMSIHFNWRRKEPEKYIDVITNKIKNITELSKLIRNKNGDTYPLWFSYVLNTVGNRHLEIKKKILDDIIKVAINNVNYTPATEWGFEVLTKIDPNHWGKNYTPESLTNLGVYKISVYPPYNGILDDYVTTAYISFDSNEFVLDEGETDKITWLACAESFSLLYYNELGLIDVVEKFKSWVIETLTTKHEKIFVDVYDDNVKKVKFDVFEDYLENPTKPDPIKKTPKPRKKPGLVTALSKKQAGISDDGFMWGDSYYNQGPEKELSSTPFIDELLNNIGGTILGRSFGDDGDDNFPF